MQEGIDVEMRKVSFLPFLIQLVVCSSPTPSFMQCLFFCFSNFALTSQADEDRGCSFKTNYGASTGAECTPHWMIRSGVHSGDERVQTDQRQSKWSSVQYIP